MSFRPAVVSTPGLGRAALRPGLQALGPLSDRVRCRDTRRLRGSVDIDSALAAADPDGQRWDYAVGHQESGGDRVYWIEVHEASPHGVTAVLGKLAWLRAWLDADGYRLRPLTKQYVWISSGRTTYLRRSQAARRLAQAGVVQAGYSFTIG